MAKLSITSQVQVFYAMRFSTVRISFGTIPSSTRPKSAFQKLLQRLKMVFPGVLLISSIVAMATCWPSKGSAQDKKSIVIIVPSLEDAYFKELAETAGAKAEKLGYSTIVCSDNLEAGMLVQLFEEAINRKAAAIICADGDSAALNLALRRSKQAGVPSLLVGREIDTTGLVAAQIVANEYQGATLGAEEFAKLLGEEGDYAELMDQYSPSASIRSKGYNDVLSRYPNLRKVDTLLAGGDKIKASYATLSLIQRDPNIKGVICGNDTMALAAEQAVQAAGVLNVVVVGFDGLPEVLNSIRMKGIKATVMLPVRQLAEAGVEEADELIRSGKSNKPQKQWLDCTLVTVEGPVQPSPSLDQIVKLLHSDQLGVRKSAVEALVNLGPAAAPYAKDLAELLNSNDPNERRIAAEALGKLGPAAAPYAKDLAKLLNSNDPNERRIAAEALGKLGQAVKVSDSSEIEKLWKSSLWIGTWNSLRTFMRWQVPKDGAELSQALTTNLLVFGAIIFLLVLLLYCVAPAKFVALHEWIVNRGIPFSESVSKILAPFLLETPYCLNAVVRRYRQRARQLFDQAPEVQTRPKWVPAPLLLGDELLQDYEPPPPNSAKKPYVAGLKEIKARLGQGDERWTVSIEGPGGVGKSALAFEIARWASDSRRDYRIGQFPMLPLLLVSLERGADEARTVDTAAAAQLRFVMSVPKISDRLLQALLGRKRVLAVLDGLAETSRDDIHKMIRPEKGTVYSQAVVITSRVSTNLPDSLVIRPQSLTLAFLDRVLDGLIAANVGSNRFTGVEREELRRHLRSLIDDARVPMIFLKLMIERADQLLKDKKQLDELPRTLSELVTDYTEQLLRNEPDIHLAMQQARTAAQVCMGKERSPAARSEHRYADKGVSKKILDEFVTAGLIVRSGEKGDPFYEFALDPIAEQLDANRLVIDIREQRADQEELDDLMARWEELPEDFVRALRRAAISYRDNICGTQAGLALKLWPEEIKTTGLNGIGLLAQSGTSTSPRSPMSGLEQSSPKNLRVFISYSHDSAEHTTRVRALADRLRKDGIDATIDQYTPDPDEGWSKWMRTQVKEADKVLLVFTETYQRRYEGDEEQGKGLGATFEGVIVTEALYEGGGFNAKFRPVVFREEDERFVPGELRRFNRYRVDTPEQYQNLLRWLYQAPSIVAPTIGQKPDLPAEPASELFSRNPVIGIDPQTTPTQTENFASEQELLLNVDIKVSAISTPWRYESRRRIVRMPRQFVESEGFGWNYQALRLDMGFRQLLLHKAKLDEDSGYNLYLEDLRYFDGDVNELKEEPHQVGDHCEVWDISERGRSPSG